MQYNYHNWWFNKMFFSKKKTKHAYCLLLVFSELFRLFWSSSLPQEHEQLSYSSTRTKAPSVIISGLKPATWYVFSVRTRTPAGYSSYSPKYEYETTGDCKYLRLSTAHFWGGMYIFVCICVSADED